MWSYFQELGFEYPHCGLDKWKHVAISLNAERISTPLLVQVSDAEALPATQTYAALRNAGAAVELYVFTDEFHFKFQPAHRMALYKRNVQWFEFWLKDVLSADPIEPGQNTRWLALRDAHVQRTTRLQE